MSRPAIVFLLMVAPILAILLAALGGATLRTNPLGWFLLLVGSGYVVGILIAYSLRRERFWESSVGGTTTLEERGDRSYWFITAGLLAVFYLPPLEYLYFAAQLPRTGWTKAGGLALVVLGITLFVWARRALRANYSGHVSVKSGQTLVQSGPYHFIRHPAYMGYLLMAIGIGLGYSSLAGLGAIPLFLIPGLVYRIRVEEKLLAAHFGEQWREYCRRVPALFPGW